MRKALYEMAILLHPTEKEAKEGASTVILVQPQYFLAQNQGEATILASRKIPDALLNDLDRVEVAVRPF
jgi:hypothetical protein